MANRRRRGDGTGTVVRLLQAMFRCAAEPAVADQKHAAYITSPTEQQQQVASTSSVRLQLEVLTPDSAEQHSHVRVHIACLDAAPTVLQLQPTKSVAQALDEGQGKHVEHSSAPSKKDSSHLLSDSSHDIAHVYALCDPSAKQEAAPFAIASHKPEDNACSPPSTQQQPFVYPIGMPFGPASSSDGIAAPEPEPSTSTATNMNTHAVHSQHNRVRSNSNGKSRSFSRIARRVLSWGGEQQLGPIERISSRHMRRGSKEQLGYERIPDDQEAEEHMSHTAHQPLEWEHPAAHSFLDQECICPAAGGAPQLQDKLCSKQHGEQRAALKLLEHTSEARTGCQLDNFKQRPPSIIHMRGHI